jgi:hypothetical protein
LDHRYWPQIRAEPKEQPSWPMGTTEFNQEYLLDCMFERLTFRVVESDEDNISVSIGQLSDMVVVFLSRGIP